MIRRPQRSTRTDTLFPDTTRVRSPRRRGSSALAWLVALLVLAGGGWFGWQWLQVRMQHERSAETRAAEHVSALEQRIDALQHEQRAQAKRLQQAATNNRVLSAELLGIGPHRKSLA